MIYPLHNKRLVYLAATVLWAGIIFYLSSIPDLASGLPSTIDLVLRKLAHITEYFILTWLLLEGLQPRSRWIMGLAIVLAILYSGSDEWHQNFVIGRNGNLRDLLIDGLGIFLAAFVYKQKTLRPLIGGRRVGNDSTLDF